MSIDSGANVVENIDNSVLFDESKDDPKVVVETAVLDGGDDQNGESSEKKDINEIIKADLDNINDVLGLLLSGELTVYNYQDVILYKEKIDKLSNNNTVGMLKQNKNNMKLMNLNALKQFVNAFVKLKLEVTDENKTDNIGKMFSILGQIYNYSFGDKNDEINKNLIEMKTNLQNILVSLGVPSIKIGDQSFMYLDKTNNDTDDNTKTAKNIEYSEDLGSKLFNKTEIDGFALNFGMDNPLMTSILNDIVKGIVTKDGEIDNDQLKDKGVLKRKVLLNILASAKLINVIETKIGKNLNVDRKMNILLGKKMEFDNNGLTNKYKYKGHEYQLIWPEGDITLDNSSDVNSLVDGLIVDVDGLSQRQQIIGKMKENLSEYKKKKEKLIKLSDEEQANQTRELIVSLLNYMNKMPGIQRNVNYNLFLSQLEKEKENLTPIINPATGQLSTNTLFNSYGDVFGVIDTLNESIDNFANSYIGSEK